MAQIAKISKQVQLKSSGHKFYEFFKNNMDYIFVQMFPEIYQSGKVVEGNGFSHGSVIHLKYNAGKPEEVKERIAIDDANKSITFECLEGDLFRDFELMKLKIQVFENGSNGSSVNWSVEFVKANEDVATPHHYLLCLSKVSKGLDDYLCNN
ncbi:kirola-like [Benincasa hispida]|uniref:kirola-like n=1 Tax=Benincasa hispida TaxID=102211 RepID=UPI0019009154|nr:kirola-like [Benincasa hispida]